MQHVLTLQLDDRLDDDQTLGICLNPYPQYLDWGREQVDFAREEHLIKEELVIPRSQILRFDEPVSPP